MWQCNSHVWCVHLSIFPHWRPQLYGIDLWQGNSDISCLPRHLTWIGSIHGGHSNSMSFFTFFIGTHGPSRIFFEISKTFFSWFHLVFRTTRLYRLTFSIISVKTAEWHLATQMCPHFMSLSHFNTQAGQSDPWQRWSCRRGWWQSAGFLYSRKKDQHIIKKISRILFIYGLVVLLAQLSTWYLYDLFASGTRHFLLACSTWTG